MSTNIVVPEVGESIVDARIAKWLRKEGDAVSAGDPLVELETDKIDLEVGAPQAGVLSRIDRKDGEDVKVGEVLGIIDEGATAPAATTPTDSEQPAAAAATDGKGAKSRATPTAKKAAEQNDVDISKVQGSGDAGRVMKRDVERVAGAPGPQAAAPPAPGAAAGSPAAAAASAEARPAAPEPAKARPSVPVSEGPPRPAGARTEERVRMSKRRATIAKRLVEAQSTAAMLSTFNEVDMTAVMALRERRKQAFKDKHG